MRGQRRERGIRRTSAPADASERPADTRDVSTSAAARADERQKERRRQEPQSTGSGVDGRLLPGQPDEARAQMPQAWSRQIGRSGLHRPSEPTSGERKKELLRQTEFRAERERGEDGKKERRNGLPSGYEFPMGTKFPQKEEEKSPYKNVHMHTSIFIDCVPSSSPSGVFIFTSRVVFATSRGVFSTIECALNDGCSRDISPRMASVFFICLPSSAGKTKHESIRATLLSQTFRTWCPSKEIVWGDELHASTNLLFLQMRGRRGFPSGQALTCDQKGCVYLRKVVPFFPCPQTFGRQ